MGLFGTKSSVRFLAFWICFFSTASVCGSFNWARAEPPEDQDDFTILDTSELPGGQLKAKLNPEPSEAPESPFTLQDDGIYYGPSALRGGAYQPDPYHSQTTYPTFLRNYLELGYNITSRWLVGAAFVSDIFPNGQNYLVAYEPTSNRYMAVDDSFVRVMAPKLIETAHFRMSADFRFYVPSSYLSRDYAGQGYSTQVRVIPTYAFPRSRWTAGAIVKETVFLNYYPWANGPNGAIINDAYIGPMVDYQVSPTVSVGVLAEFETERYVGSQGFFDYTVNNPENPTPCDIEPNLSWNITPRVNWNPFLELYPGGKITWDQVQFGFLFGAKLL